MRGSELQRKVDTQIYMILRLVRMITNEIHKISKLCAAITSMTYEMAEFLWNRHSHGIVKRSILKSGRVVLLLDQESGPSNVVRKYCFNSDFLFQITY